MFWNELDIRIVFRQCDGFVCDISNKTLAEENICTNDTRIGEFFCNWFRGWILRFSFQIKLIKFCLVVNVFTHSSQSNDLSPVCIWMNCVIKFGDLLWLYHSFMSLMLWPCSISWSKFNVCLWLWLCHSIFGGCDRCPKNLILDFDRHHYLINEGKRKRLQMEKRK